MKSFYGIIDGHAYSIHHPVEITDDAGKKHRIVQVRNPWAREEYTGPWSDNDKRWTASTRKQVDHRPGNDGFYYVPFEEVFLGGFPVFSVTAYRDTWKTASTGIIQAKTTSTRWDFDVYNPRDQEVIFTFDSVSPRMMPLDCPRQAMNNFNIFVQDA